MVSRNLGGRDRQCAFSPADSSPNFGVVGARKMYDDVRYSLFSCTPPFNRPLDPPCHVPTPSPPKTPFVLFAGVACHPFIFDESDPILRAYSRIAQRILNFPVDGYSKCISRAENSYLAWVLYCLKARIFGRHLHPSEDVDASCTFAVHRTSQPPPGKYNMASISVRTRHHAPKSTAIAYLFRVLHGRSGGLRQRCRE